MLRFWRMDTLDCGNVTGSAGFFSDRPVRPKPTQSQVTYHLPHLCAHCAIAILTVPVNIFRRKLLKFVMKPAFSFIVLVHTGELLEQYTEKIHAEIACKAGVTVAWH